MPEALAGTLVMRFAAHVLMLADALLHGLKVSKSLTGTLIRRFAYTIGCDHLPLKGFEGGPETLTGTAERTFPFTLA